MIVLHTITLDTCSVSLMVLLIYSNSHNDLVVSVSDSLDSRQQLNLSKMTTLMSSLDSRMTSSMSHLNTSIISRNSAVLLLLSS